MLKRSNASFGRNAALGFWGKRIDLRRLHLPWQNYRAIRKSYALVYRDDEVQPVSRSERPPFQSYPRRKHCCWISRGGPFPTLPFVGTKRAQGRSVLSCATQATLGPDVDD